MTSPLDPPPTATLLDLPGLEPDNLLAFLALLGLLRALETARPAWRPRTSWRGPPWVARLHLAETTDEESVASAAAEGIASLAAQFDVAGNRNVSQFDPSSYRTHMLKVRSNETNAALCAALMAEWPRTKSGGLQAAPLVMMFGQGHQNFLERLVDVPRGELPRRFERLKSPPNMGDPAKIAEALFTSWQRDDDADAFRWDPEEDQRYALRFDDPSGGGAALTVHGANRLAAIGFLSFATTPRKRRQKVVGAMRDERDWFFLWPIWLTPLSRTAIEAFLAHPNIAETTLDELHKLGVVELFRAQRIQNGKFMNVTRARPVSNKLR
ncbi:MAG: hypothetical protein AB7P52_03985 [Alphaproteobacteria bacterium]